MFTPGGTNQYDQFGFAESLRHGPLSPNMLAGPTSLPFDPSTFRTGLTPNESNIRTGLTPGNTPGFPLLPTPGTAALLGPYTPNTTAALASMQSSTYPVPPFVPPGRTNDPFTENQAASGLVFLAQTSQQQANLPAQSAPTREELAKRAAINNSKVNAYQDPSALTKKSEESKTTTRSKKTKDDPPSSTKESKSKKTKAQETDDEKRRNFLERNRQGTPLEPPLSSPFAHVYVYAHVSLFQSPALLPWNILLTCHSRPKMPPTQKTMALKSPTKSRLVLPRKRTPLLGSRPTPRTSHRSEDPPRSPQGLQHRATEWGNTRSHRAGSGADGGFCAWVSVTGVGGGILGGDVR